MTAQPGTALEPRDAARDLANTIRGDQFKQQVAVALPEGVNPDRFVRIMATALLDKPEIAVQCDINSIFQAGLKAAQDGLLPDGREAAFAVFGDQCVYMPMVGGFRKIAAEYGWSLRTAVVYANDAFEYEEGEEPHLIHRPVRPGAEQGAKIAAYAVAQHKDGRRLFEVMDAAAVLKRKAVARTKKVWDQWEETMWEKTPARRLFGKLPLDEADRARVERVLQASALEPGEAARTMYGDEDRTQLPQIPPASDPEPVDGEVGATGGEEHFPEDAPAAATPPADFADDAPTSTFEPPASVRQQTEPSQTDLLTAQAGEVRFHANTKQHGGKTIAEVWHDDPMFIRKTVEQAIRPELKEAARTYLAAMEAKA